MTRFALLIPAALLLSTSACIAQPYDGEEIASHPTTIIPHIDGYGTELGQTAHIFALNASVIG